jgi:hypothetical protein
MPDIAYIPTLTYKISTKDLGRGILPTISINIPIYSIDIAETGQNDSNVLPAFSVVFKFQFPARAMR